MARNTKRPHFIPISYLQAWADEADQVAVRRRDGRKIFTPNVVNVAVNAGIYGRGAEGQSQEELFNEIEGEWPALRDALRSHGGALGGSQRDLVAVFAALQLVRTREHVARNEFLHGFAEFSDRRPVEREDIRRYLSERHLGFAPSDAEVEGAWTIAYAALNQGDLPTREQMLAMSLGMAVTEFAPRLGRMQWSVEHCRTPILMTSDRPVMNWRPASRRDRFEGIGIETAEEVRLPLAPNELLVMRHVASDGPMTEVQVGRFKNVNRDIGAQCHEFVVATRQRARELDRLILAKHRPIVRFNTGPGHQRFPDGHSEAIGDIVHMWTPVRASVPSGRSRRSTRTRAPKDSRQ
jgi:hypothetical protein